ncbi:MAG TPA: VCBS repeat-containing protein, partial [bacterium]|nr:VCBS repeat-containing protein [bacterium]
MTHFPRSTIFLVLILWGLLISCPGSEQSGAGSSAANPRKTEIAFRDITREAGLGDFLHETGAFGMKWMPETFGSGGGFIDYNDDGWMDILLVGGGSWPEHTGRHIRILWLYENNGDGTFTLQSREAGLDGISTYGFGITCADYDNDGDEDFFFTTVYENMLFRNDNGVFTEVGNEAGVVNQSTWSTAALFFDADRDGWPDLYVGNYVDWSPEKDIFCSIDGVTKEYCTPLLYDGVPGRFYHNNGDGTFSDRTEQAGFLPAPGKTLGAAKTDYNRDGWP